MNNTFAQSGALAVGEITSPTMNIDVGGSGVRLRVPNTPPSGNAQGNPGTVVWDANYIYVCTATNHWKRVAIANW